MVLSGDSGIVRASAGEALTVIRVPANYSRLQKVVGILQLIRVEKPLAAGIVTLAGVYLGAGMSSVFSSAALRAALAIFLIDAFSFAFNDLADAVGDRINKPYRPVPSGRVSPQLGFVVAVALAIAGLAVAATLGWLLASFAAALVVLSVWYSLRLKGSVLLGNAVIAFMVASVLAYGSLVAGGITWQVLAACVWAFLFLFSSEILHTIPDEEADRTAGKRTVAVRLGCKRAFRLFQLTVALAGFTAVLPWLVGMASLAFLLAAMAFGLLPIAFTLGSTASGSPQAVGRATVLMKCIAFTGLVPILLLR